MNWWIVAAAYLGGIVSAFVGFAGLYVFAEAIDYRNRCLAFNMAARRNVGAEEAARLMAEHAAKDKPWRKDA